MLDSVLKDIKKLTMTKDAFQTYKKAGWKTSFLQFKERQTKLKLALLEKQKYEKMMQAKAQEYQSQSILERKMREKQMQREMRNKAERESLPLQHIQS